MKALGNKHKCAYCKRKVNYECIRFSSEWYGELFRRPYYCCRVCRKLRVVQSYIQFVRGG